jgi:hypothetical protein
VREGEGSGMLGGRGMNMLNGSRVGARTEEQCDNSIP